MFLFRTPPSGAQWFSVGLTSSFPNLGLDDEVVAQPRDCGGSLKPGCKVFQAPGEDGSEQAEVQIAERHPESFQVDRDLKDQVLVFQYRGKFHAIDHKCPHSAYPLSQGTPFDIEDFGVVLSAGISCPKHGWSFDLFTGMSDRAQYRLTIWEVQLREIEGQSSPSSTDKISESIDKEVWVRRKQRIG